MTLDLNSMALRCSFVPSVGLADAVVQAECTVILNFQIRNLLPNYVEIHTH